MQHASRSLRDLFYRGDDPEILRSPELDDSYQTNVKGVHIIGDLTGIPLLKNAVNMGHEFIEMVADDLLKEPIEDDEYHLVIVGAGGAGLAAALAAKERGLKYLVLEQKIAGNTIHKFFKGKEIFAEPSSIPNKSKLWVEDATKETLLKKWQDSLDSSDLNIETCQQVNNIQRSGKTLKVETVQGKSYPAKRVAIAMGRSGNPRMLNIPGEELSKVRHTFVDPEIFIGKNITIVGGGDTSIEAALALAPHNNVTLIIRAPQISRAQKKNTDRLQNAVENRQLTLLMSATVKTIGEREIKVDTEGEVLNLPNDDLFILIGSTPPFSFLNRLKIRHVGDWSIKRVIYLLLFTLLISFLYGWKKPLFYPFKINGAANPLFYDWTSWQPSMWFGFLYSLVITTFGIKAIRKYGKDSYQVKRYSILIFSQVVLFWIIPEILFQAILKVPNGWRSYGLFYPAPLYVWNFWSPESAHAFWFIWTVALTIIGVPLMAIFSGKKYCAYVCSCGGLAETLGDAFRTLSPRGRRARSWENMLTYAVTVFVAMVVIFGIMDANSSWWEYQRVFIDFALAGVIGIAAYPFWGNRIWCRFLCPLAKMLYIFAKDSSRVKIGSGSHCIRCTLCTKYCQMGIPVMEFALRGEEFSNRETSCIQCGICVTVCPTRNLQHGDWSEDKWTLEIKKGPPVHVN